MLVFWILFNLFMAAMLALDLGVLHRSGRRVAFREGLAWSGVWVALAACFAVIEFVWHGRTQSLQFVTAYIVELSLSVDNLFLFLLAFRYFKVPTEYQRKVLFWGIVGALLLRGLFIGVGVGLIRRFDWISYGFGAILIYSGARLLGQGKSEIHPEKNSVLMAFRRLVPVTPDYLGDKFFARTKVDGKSSVYATPLFVVLLLIESSDLLFAVDSIPAVLSITVNAFIVYTSTAFALLGLRSLYFALAGMMERFHYLHYGLSLVLVLIGMKMLAARWMTIPTEWTLGVVVVVLGAAMMASWVIPQKKLAA